MFVRERANQELFGASGFGVFPPIPWKELPYNVLGSSSQYLFTDSCVQTGKRQKKNKVKPSHTQKPILWIGQPVAGCPRNRKCLSITIFKRDTMLHILLALAIQLLNTIYNVMYKLIMHL